MRGSAVLCGAHRVAVVCRANVKAFCFHQARTLSTAPSRWGQRWLRSHGCVWKTRPKSFPSSRTYTKRQLKRLRLAALTRIRPVWQSRRAPLLGHKIGAMHLWDEWGERHMTTVVQVDQLHVLERLTVPKHGLEGLRMGIGTRSAVKASKAQIGEAIKLNLPLKHTIQGRPCSTDCALPVGHCFSVKHFTPGQYVMVAGMTRARGFQGFVKRWGFQGEDADTGTPRSSRRAGGSIGTHGDAMVRRGRKMPGHMGPDPRCVLLKVFRTELERQLLFLRGTIPGPPGTVVTIFDARGSAWVLNRKIKIPWPTFIPKVSVQYPTTQQCPPPQTDPFLYTERPIYGQGRPR